MLTAQFSRIRVPIDVHEPAPAFTAPIAASEPSSFRFCPANPVVGKAARMSAD